MPWMNLAWKNLKYLTLKNNMFENVTDGELINELESRGYVTNLLFCREDVKMQLESINEEREDQNEPPLVLDDDDADAVLNELNFDYPTEMINDRIYNLIIEMFVDDEDED